MKINIKRICCIGSIWVIAVLLLCGHAYAASSVDVDPSPEPTWITVPTSSVQVSGEEIPGSYPIYRISQGDTVYLGDHIDISGALAGNPDIAYFKGEDYQDYSVSPVILPLPNQKSGWYDFYIDPEVFVKYPGTWHKWNGYYEFHANTVAFKVVALYRNTTMTYQNGTVVNTSELVSGTHNVSITPKTTEILPAKHIADYVIPRYSSLNITVADKSAVWIFDTTDNSIVYSESVFTGNGSEIQLSESAIYSLPPSKI